MDFKILIKRCVCFCKVGLAGMLALSLSSCGTLTTITNPDFVIKKDLQKKGTICKRIPRIYSGVRYDYCVVMSNPVSGLDESYTEDHIFDFIGSGMLDTLVLPYTIFLQLSKGSLEIGKP